MMKSASAILDTNGFELSLIKVRRVDVEREDVAGARGAREAAILGDRLDALAIDLEQHRAALDAAVERGAHRLDARDQHACSLLPQLQPLRRLPTEIAAAESNAHPP